MRILDAPIEQVVTIPADERYPGDWRVIKGLTQPELAAAAKIATTTLRGIERADIGADRRQRREAGPPARHQRRGVPRGLPARPAAPGRHFRVTWLCKFSKRTNAIKWQDTTKSATFRAAVARSG